MNNIINLIRKSDYNTIKNIKDNYNFFNDNIDNINIINNYMNKNASNNSNKINLYLFISCCYDNIDIISIFLNENNINYRNIYGHTPIYYSCCFDNIEGIRYLLEKGANIDTFDDNGLTPLTYSIVNNKTNSALELINYINKNNMSYLLNDQNLLGYNVLMYACKYDNQIIVEKLINSNVNIYIRDKLNQTANMLTTNTYIHKLFNNMYDFNKLIDNNSIINNNSNYENAIKYCLLNIQKTNNIINDEICPICIDNVCNVITKCNHKYCIRCFLINYESNYLRSIKLKTRNCSLCRSDVGDTIYMN